MYKANQTEIWNSKIMLQIENKVRIPMHFKTITIKWNACDKHEIIIDPCI